MGNSFLSKNTVSTLITLAMSALPPELLDQIHTWSSNKSPIYIWTITWTDPDFLFYFGKSCGLIAFFWVLTIGWLQCPKSFILEHATAMIHAVLNVIISSLFLLNYSDSQLLQMNLDRGSDIPSADESILFGMRFFLAFQSAFCVMDSIQLLEGIVFQRERVSFRITLIIHHLLILMCCTGLYLVDPYVQRLYAQNSLIEITTICLQIRNFAKYWESTNWYFVGGLGTLILYPIIRAIVPVYCAYTVLYGAYGVFVSANTTKVMLAFNAFVFVMSMYYSVFVLWSSPSSIYKLNRKTK